MTINQIIDLCFEKNRNKHIDNGNSFYINCYGYGVLKRFNGEYFVSKGVLEGFHYKEIKKLKFEQLNHLQLVLEKVLKNYEDEQVKT